MIAPVMYDRFEINVYSTDERFAANIIDHDGSVSPVPGDYRFRSEALAEAHNHIDLILWMEAEAA